MIFFNDLRTSNSRAVDDAPRYQEDRRSIYKKQCIANYAEIYSIALCRSEARAVANAAYDEREQRRCEEIAQFVVHLCFDAPLL
jgi:hypothetical protein